jgi:uncharacterized protein
MKVAIIGSGIAGLAAAHTLRGLVNITLFEADTYFGGHTHTVDITLPTLQGPLTHGVDTGFLVMNERTYPNLIALFKELGIATARSEMSFSVQAFNAMNRNGNSDALEWSGSSLNTVFAQRRNLLNWRFLNMLREVLRFNKLATRLALNGNDGELRQSLGDFLQNHHFSAEFCDWYLLPMLACIWSCPAAQMLQFPVATMIRFCHNHGLVQTTNRPQWWTVQGGARQYVKNITARIADKRLNTPVLSVQRHSAGQNRTDGQISVSTRKGSETFDKVIIATHSDQGLALLNSPSALERHTLNAIKYQSNRAVLHTDTSVLPTRRAAWAAWNYERAATAASSATGDPGHSKSAGVCLHYLINRLQPLPWPQPVLVSLNPIRTIDPAHILGEYDYAHPVFDLAAMAAQRDVPKLQGNQGTYFCGAWMGYGFHEDGLKAGVAAARQLLQDAGLAPAAERAATL